MKSTFYRSLQLQHTKKALPLTLNLTKMAKKYLIFMVIYYPPIKTTTHFWIKKIKPIFRTTNVFQRIIYHLDVQKLAFLKFVCFKKKVSHCKSHSCTIYEEILK